MFAIRRLIDCVGHLFPVIAIPSYTPFGPFSTCYDLVSTIMLPSGAMHRGVAESVLDLIGQTPLLHLSRFAKPPLADIYAKIEWLNPGGSV